MRACGNKEKCAVTGGDVITLMAFSSRVSALCVCHRLAAGRGDTTAPHNEDLLFACVSEAENDRNKPRQQHQDRISQNMFCFPVCNRSPETASDINNNTVTHVLLAA